MSSETSAQELPPSDVFSNLLSVCHSQGLSTLSERLGELSLLLHNDMREIELSIGHVGKLGGTMVHQAAKHLLEQGGKRIRPMCVMLSAHAVAGVNEAARALAVAVELVHSATLLHDDVVDLGERRRGVDAARVIYGNAISIFGGDYLLTEALHRIVRTNISGVLERILDVIQEMVAAEALQIAKRGQFNSDVNEYFQIVSGKTASLFRWAMYAGARAAGAGEELGASLGQYGQKLGMAFQLVDDVLDFTGEPALMGKALLTDLREGKMTYPLLLAMERDPSVRPVLARVYSDGENGALLVEAGLLLKESMAKNGVIGSCTKAAQDFCGDAIACLAQVSHGPAKDALERLAAALPNRKR